MHSRLETSQNIDVVFLPKAADVIYDGVSFSYKSLVTRPYLEELRAVWILKYRLRLGNAGDKEFILKTATK